VKPITLSLIPRIVSPLNRFSIRVFNKRLTEVTCRLSDPRPVNRAFNSYLSWLHRGEEYSAVKPVKHQSVFGRCRNGVQRRSCLADQEQLPFDVGSLVDFRLVSARRFLQGRFQQLPMHALSTLWLVRKLTIKAFTSCGGGMKEAIVPAQCQNFR